MRILVLIPLALATSGCWTPGPGQIDPTRYPWDQPHLRQAKAQPQPELKANYCIMSLESGNSNGITAVGGNTVNLVCQEPQPQPEP